MAGPTLWFRTHLAFLALSRGYTPVGYIANQTTCYSENDITVLGFAALISPLHEV
jgi:hypothetical protein